MLFYTSNNTDRMGLIRGVLRAFLGYVNVFYFYSDIIIVFEKDLTIFKPFTQGVLL